MADDTKRRAVHTEHMLFECDVSPDNVGEVELFRAPTVLDGSGTHRRMLHRIHWKDARVGDMILAVRIADLADPGVRVIDVLQFWHVLEVAAPGQLRVEVNSLVSPGDYGENVYDRVAGLLSLPPGERPG